MSEIKRYGLDKVETIMIANKKDLYDSSQHQENKQLCHQMAEKHDMPLVETSGTSFNDSRWLFPSEIIWSSFLCFHKNFQKKAKTDSAEYLDQIIFQLVEQILNNDSEQYHTKIVQLVDWKGIERVLPNIEKLLVGASYEFDLKKRKECSIQ